jgi:pantoate--beta-alanine ligase
VNLLTYKQYSFRLHSGQLFFLNRARKYDFFTNFSTYNNSFAAIKTPIMQVFRTVEAVKNALGKVRENQQKIGFVPTMGALHSGHLNLIQEAQRQNDVVVVSIFVNPTQFNNSNDLEKYPRVPQQDLGLLEAQGVDMAFLPTVEEVYPSKAVSESFDFGGLDEVMEGSFRPGHFKGVATVVKRFFDIVKPDEAYFGEKDFQQLQVIRRLAEQLPTPPNIKGIPTQRSEKGLALSSRNALLSPQELKDALLIYRSLHWAQKQVTRSTPQEIEREITARFAASPLQLEYVQIAAEDNLKPIRHFSSERPTRIFLAAYAGSVRLIDNVSLI